MAAASRPGPCQCDWLPRITGETLGRKRSPQPLDDDPECQNENWPDSHHTRRGRCRSPVVNIAGVHLGQPYTKSCPFTVGCREAASSGWIGAHLAMGSERSGGIVEERTVALADPNMSFFSEEYIRFVEAAIEYYWDKTGTETSDDSHGAAWSTRGDVDPMPYELALLSDEPLDLPHPMHIEKLIYERGWNSQSWPSARFGLIAHATPAADVLGGYQAIDQVLWPSLDGLHRTQEAFRSWRPPGGASDMFGPFLSAVFQHSFGTL
jgi:hypothetical protein